MNVIVCETAAQGGQRVAAGCGFNAPVAVVGHVRHAGDKAEGALAGIHANTKVTRHFMRALPPLLQ